MSPGLLMIFGISIVIVIIIGTVIVKMIFKKELPSNSYTPFDYIMGQSPVEFHEEKQEKEVDADQGDDKNKNLKSFTLP